MFYRKGGRLKEIWIEGEREGMEREKGYGSEERERERD